MINWNEKAKALGFEDEKTMLLALYREYSLSQLAELLKVSTSSLGQYMSSCGLTLRSRGGANNISKLRVLFHRVDQRLFKLIRASVLARALKVSKYQLRDIKRRKREYGVLHNNTSRRVREVRDDVEDSSSTDSSEE